MKKIEAYVEIVLDFLVPRRSPDLSWQNLSVSNHFAGQTLFGQADFIFAAVQEYPALLYELRASAKSWGANKARELQSLFELMQQWLNKHLPFSSLEMSRPLAKVCRTG